MQEASQYNIQNITLDQYVKYNEFGWLWQIYNGTSGGKIQMHLASDWYIQKLPADQ